jgi:uncharacterized membrane protein YdbT with pleckstrin-like domain
MPAFVLVGRISALRRQYVISAGAGQRARYNKPFMPGRTIRPTMKLIKAGYAAVALAVVFSFTLYDRFATTQGVWLPALSLLLLAWPLSRQLRRGFTRITLSGDKLRYESGFLSKTTSTLQLSKIQNVSVEQSITQRILGTGNISIETAGETSRLTMRDVDGPQKVADYIMDAAHTGFTQQA